MDPLESFFCFQKLNCTEKLNCSEKLNSINFRLTEL
jgi:hypothetical protein